MAFARRRIASHNSKITGTGGGGAGTIATVAIGPSYGNTALSNTVTTGLFNVSPKFQGLSNTSSVGLGTLTTLMAGPTSTLSTAKGTYTANYDYGATVVTQTGAAGNGWVSPTNAQGLHNGTNATITGSATAAQAGKLTMTYPAQGGNGFTITSVTLNFYSTQSGTTLGNGTLAHLWGISGTGTTLATFTGNVTNAPATYDITATIAGSWTNVTNIQAAVSANYALANLSVSTCDAIEVVIVATF